MIRDLGSKRYWSKRVEISSSKVLKGNKEPDGRYIIATLVELASAVMEAWSSSTRCMFRQGRGSPKHGS